MSVKTTQFLAVALTVGCNDYGYGDPPPEWPAPAPVPLEDQTRTDVIVQTTTPQVDILWMVDNSCSMGDDQTRLTSNFPSFMDFFVGSGLDFHVGVTSSDTISTAPNGADGKLVIQRGVKFLDPETPDPINLFSEMATLGINGRYPERGIGATFLCLEEKRDTLNAGFYRDDAALHTVIISDEPDYTQEGVITLNEYKAWYDGLKTDAENRTYSGIIHPNYGGRYAQVIDAIGGIEESVLVSDWSNVLERIGLQAAGLKREYFLSGVPVASTIEVAVITPQGIEQHFDAEQWSYDPTRNSITFYEFVPDALSKVQLHYVLLSSLQNDEPTVE